MLADPWGKTLLDPWGITFAGSWGSAFVEPFCPAVCSWVFTRIALAWGWWTICWFEDVLFYSS